MVECCGDKNTLNLKYLTCWDNKFKYMSWVEIFENTRMNTGV